MEKKFKKRGVDYPIIDGTRTLPGKYYHSPEIYQEEAEKIFYKFWLYACREEEIASPGDYKLIPVVDESIIVVRDKTNGIQAHFNVCRHRGTQLCAEPKGNFKGKSIQCPYHAWTYALDGQLLSAPLMQEGHGFNKADCALHQAAVYVWEGFVFINLAKNPVPFEEQMGALIGKFADWKMSELRIARSIRYELNCNWKLILQNYQECYHCPGVHPLLTKLTPVQSAQHDVSDGAVIGGFMDLSKTRGSMTMNGEAAAPPICNVSGDDLQRIYYYSVFPSMLLTPHPDFVMFHHITPVGTEKIINDCFWLFRPEIINDPKAQEGINSAVEFWDLTNKQDWMVCEQMQIGTRSHRFDRGYYSGREDILHQLDQEVLKALGHKAE
ncbi:MAG: aromatic ring-hydroxylating dioxygenase subunit alpha [Cyclobacteriaceae bacterium]|nr:aromatic ring-hydroxylating dioxygenase subunit alpha [Cyclobacteriaceae bacterium]